MKTYVFRWTERSVMERTVRANTESEAMTKFENGEYENSNDSSEMDENSMVVEEVE